MVLGSIVSFVAAVAGIYRLGSSASGPSSGWLAALLLLSRFFVRTSPRRAISTSPTSR